MKKTVFCVLCLILALFVSSLSVTSFNTENAKTVSSEHSNGNSITAPVKEASFAPVGGNDIPLPPVRIYKDGDVDLNGKIEKNDADLLADYLTHKIELNETQKSVADVNNDDKIDISDCVAIVFKVNN